jgi:dTDP-4-dehydrorhamnose reductase
LVSPGTQPAAKIAVIGANGQLGADVCRIFRSCRYQVVEFNHDRVDIVDRDSCHAALACERPAVVINTAAMHDVEACEADPARAFQVNGLGPRNLALLAAELDFALVHISTDYVFDGAKGGGYSEDDLPRPLNVYGNTKLAGEYFVMSEAPRHFVVRTSGLFGTNPSRGKGGRNFVTTMLGLATKGQRLRVVDGEVLSPTHTLDVARQLVSLVTTGAYGLYHAASQGECSWHAFTRAILQLTGSRAELSVAGPGEFPNKVRRPAYSVLTNRRLQRLGIDCMPQWQDGLAEYLQLIGALASPANGVKA